MQSGVRALAQQRGVAIVTALLLTTLSVTIVSGLFWQQQVQVRSLENQRMQLQKQWIFRSGLDWAALILHADALNSGADHLGEQWAAPLAETLLRQDVENGKVDGDVSDATLSGSIVDAQSRYNLNNLAAGGMVNPDEVLVLRNLMMALKLNPSLAQTAAEAIAASQPENLVAGARPAVNQAQNIRSRPMKINYLDDLLGVPGYTQTILDKLQDFVVVLPVETKINANTAPLEVLTAKLATIDTLSKSDAIRLAASRKSAHLRDPCDLGNRLGRTDLPCDMLEHSTEYFLFNGKVRMNHAGLDMQALLRREGNAAPKVIWIREK